MIQPEYTEPISQLLTLGDARGTRDKVDYLALGITTNDIPELGRLSLDLDLMWASSESDEVWAPIHAWRTLGQLRDPAGVPIMMEVVRHANEWTEEWDDEWCMEEPPHIFAMLGEPAIEPLSTFITEAHQDESGAISAAMSLKEIAKAHPQYRDACVHALQKCLQNFESHSDWANSVVISELVDLNAVEAKAEMEAAFAANRVDLTMAGDWENIQIGMGLLKERTTPPSADGNWFAAENKRMLDKIEEYGERIELLESKIEHREEKRLIDAQREKRNQARKQTKQAKKKQRAKTKKKKRKKK